MAKTFNGFAQQIGINTEMPDQSAVLDIVADDKGILVPRLATNQRIKIENPATGLLVFDTDTRSFWYHTGSGWTDMIDRQELIVSEPNEDPKNGRQTENSSNPNKIQDADGDTKIQVEEAADEDLIRFDLGGVEKWVMNDYHLAPSNFIGNLFIGQNAGLANSQGQFNTFLGNNTGSKNTSGQDNLFVGSSAGKNNTTGFENTFLGSYAGSENTHGQRNVFVGNFAGDKNTVGTLNTFIGSNAGAGNTTGNFNVFVGFASGKDNTSGIGNVFLGHFAGANETGDNKLYIENSHSSSPLIYGEFNNDLLKINGTLDLKQPTNAKGLTLESNDDSNNWMLLTDFADDLTLAYNGSWKSYINKADGSYVQYSDRNLKRQIHPMESSLEKIVELQPTTYTYKEDESQTSQIGFIAQEVEAFFPEAVHEKNGYKSLNYSVFGVLAIQGIKEQQQQIEVLKTKIGKMERELKEIRRLLGK